jgi:hypothetical protein
MPPCCPSPVLVIQLYDLHRLMVDRTGDFPRRIEFSPCSEGGARYTVASEFTLSSAARCRPAWSIWRWRPGS